MPVTQDRLSRLRDFGLSEYAARAYLALLDLGIAEARDVSSISKVPQAKIYHVLEQLHEKGLVVILPEFPKKYAPVPFEEYLDRLHEEHTKAAETIEREREDLASLFAVVGDVDVGDRGFFTVLRGRRNVLAKIEEIILATKRDLLVLGTVGTTSRAASLLHAFRATRERNVRIRMLVPIEHHTLGGLEKLREVVDVRARDLDEEEQSRKVAIVLSDGERAFLIHFVPDDGNLYTGKDIGVFTDQEAMVAAIQAIMEPHWSRAEPLDARKNVLQTGREPDFTRIYTREGEAAEALLRSLSRGVKEVCVMDGRPSTQPPAAVRPVLAEIARQQARFRAILNIPDTAAVDAFEDLGRGFDSLEVRHGAPRLDSRHWILDNGEAFFSLSRDGRDPGEVGELVVHTNHAAVVGGIQRHFEGVWATAPSLAVRRRELEAFPHLQPGEVGLGVLFHLHSDAVVVADPDGQIRLWNPAAARIFGYTAEEALQLRLADLFQEGFEDDLDPTSLSELDRLGEGARLLEGVARRRDGTPLDMECSLARVSGGNSGRPLVLAVMRDMTTRKRAAAAERATKERILEVHEHLVDGFVVLDRDWRILYANRTTERMKTIWREGVIGEVLWDSFPDIVGTRIEAEYRRAMREQVPVRFDATYKGRILEIHAYPSDEGLALHFRDVTDRKDVEPGTDPLEMRFQRAFAVSPVGMAVVTREGRILDANARFAEAMGRPGETLHGRLLVDLVDGSEGKALARLWESVGESAHAMAELLRAGGKGRVRLSLAFAGSSEGSPPEYLVQAVDASGTIPVRGAEGARATKAP